MYINDLRIRATDIASRVLEAARHRASTAVDRVDGLRTSLNNFAVAGKGLREVARRHGKRFVAENVSIASAVGKDVSALAATTLKTFTQPATKVARPRKAIARKRRVAKAA